MSAGNAVLALGVAWLVIGVGVATALARQGQPPPTALAAVIAWPALLPLFSMGAVDGVGTGPFAERIALAFAALRLNLSDPLVAGVTDSASLAGIETSLRRADARIAAVDRLLSDASVAADPGSERLRDARQRAAAEVEGVLRQLVNVRVQLGLVALAGDTSLVRAHLGELAARAKALEEVAVC